MGLSRKLGGNKSNTEADDITDYQWSSQCYTLSDIVERFGVPRVVLCASPCAVNWSRFEFNLNQPLLIYDKRRVKKASSRTLKHDDASGEMLAFGPPVVIPQDYDGWFVLLDSGTDTFPRHTRIESIAHCLSNRFLVGTVLPALVHAPGIDGEVQYVASDIMPGEILKKVDVCESDDIMAEVMPQLKAGRPCLRCTDEKNDDLIIPFHHRAKMFEISNDDSATTQGLIRICQIINNCEALFPMVVRHMFGEPPAVAFNFTGDLKLESVFEEESVLASTLDKESPFPLEIKTESKVKFYIALNESDIKRTSHYTVAASACDDLGERYMTGMKVAFTLHPEMVPLDPLDLSLSGTDSDAEDVDAQSEFVIDWDPDRTNSVLSLKNNPVVLPVPDIIARKADSNQLVNTHQSNDKKSCLQEMRISLDALSEEMV